MKLTVVGSGSDGNSILLQNDSEALLIDAGVPVLEVKKALGFNIIKLKGAIVSHCHSDHSKYIPTYQKMGIPVYAPYQTGSQIQHFDRFTVKTFSLVHDVPCFGFYIFHPEIGSLIYATDTEYIKYHFSGINHILVEANYSSEEMELNAANKEHVMTGHMEIKTTLDFIRKNDNDDLREVVLMHLSQSNADSGNFLKMAQKITNKPVYIAKKGLEIDLSLIPDCFKGM